VTKVEKHAPRTREKAAGTLRPRKVRDVQSLPVKKIRFPLQVVRYFWMNRMRKLRHKREQVPLPVDFEPIHDVLDQLALAPHRRVANLRLQPLLVIERP